jgi:hypothetical protein
MTYTRIDYEHKMKQQFLTALTLESRLRGLLPKCRLRGLNKKELAQLKATLNQLEN